MTFEEVRLSIEVEHWKAMFVLSVASCQALETELLKHPVDPKNLGKALSHSMETLPVEIQDRIIKVRKDLYGIE